MIEINNLTRTKINKKFLSTVAKKVITGENKEIENLSIAFVSSEEIKKLNKEHRKKDKPTDVLSFGKAFDFTDDSAEIVICPDVVKQNAKSYGVTFEKEMTKMLIHGILHILGYDHEKSEKEAVLMEAREDFYLNNIFKPK